MKNWTLLLLLLTAFYGASAQITLFDRSFNMSVQSVAADIILDDENRIYTGGSINSCPMGVILLLDENGVVTDTALAGQDFPAQASVISDFYKMNDSVIIGVGITKFDDVAFPTDFTVLSLLNGQIDWIKTYASGGSDPNDPSVAVLDGFIYVSTTTALTKLNSQGDSLWQKSLSPSLKTDLAVLNGDLILGHGNGLTVVDTGGNIINSVPTTLPVTHLETFNDTLFSVESDNHHPMLKQYNNTLQPIDSLFALPFDVITDLSVSEDGAWVVGSYQGKTKLFGATRSMDFIKQFTLQDEALSGTALVADEGILIIAGTDGRIFVKTVDIATENGDAANPDVEVQEAKVDSFYTTPSAGCPPGLTCLDIHYSLEVKVKNNGAAPLEQLYLNHYPGGGFNCSFPVAYNGYAVQVAPGNTETVILAGGVKTSIPTTSFPKTFDICVFSSGPDEALDKDRTNDTSCTTHTFTGINEVSREPFRIYPNPANDVLYIFFAGEEAAVAEVFNAKGQLIKQMEIISSATPIQIPDLLPGIYFVKLTSGTASHTVKFVKQQ